MKGLRPLVLVCCCSLMLGLAGCGEKQAETTAPVEVLETHIQHLDLAADDVQTRFGKLEITRSAESSPLDTLKLNGTQVFQQESEYLSLHAYIQQAQRDLVVFGSNCGGTACPQNDFYFLILAKDSKPNVVTQDNFSAYPADLKVDVDGKKILLDLGFESGKHKTGVLDEDVLSITLTDAPKTFIGEENCQWLQHDGLSACIDYHEVEEKCSDPQSEFAAYLSSGLEGMKNYPGFDAAAFDRHCITACQSQHAPDYETFAKETCSKGL